MPDWKELIGAMVPLGVAVAKPGQSGASFVQGWQGAEQQLWQRRQQENEAQRRQHALEAEQANRDADNQRAEQQARLHRLSMALQQLQPAIGQQAEYATDPTQAESALLRQSHQLESSFELPPSSLSGYVPPMAPMISQRKIKRAKDKYSEFLKLYGERASEAENSFTFHEGEFQGMTPAQVRGLGEMMPPPPPKKTPPTPGSFEEYVGLSPDQQAVRQRQRRDWSVADNQPRPVPPQALSSARESVYQAILGGSDLTSLARRLRQLDLDPDVEFAKARRQIEDDIRQLEAKLPETYSGERGEPGQYEQRLARARAMLRQTVTGGSGSTPPPPPKPAPTSGGTITRQELRSVASRLGITEQQAEQEAKSRGMTIVP